DGIRDRTVTGVQTCALPIWSITSVAKELGLRDSVLRRWVEKLRQEPASAARRPTTQATPMPADQASEIARLRQENERLRMERDILKKSIATFAGTQTSAAGCLDISPQRSPGCPLSPSLADTAAALIALY